jgi:hypothetical protein
MKHVSAVLPSVMGGILSRTPLDQLLALPQRREGNAAAKRDMARELRRQADRTERAAPSVGGSVERAAAVFLREIAAACDNTARAIETETRATGAAA